MVKHAGLAICTCLATMLTSAAAPAASSCQIANVTPLGFGAYRSGTAIPVDSVGQIDIACTGPTLVSVQIGRSSSGRLSPREMTYLGVALAYNVFFDAGHSVVWGDGTEGTRVQTGFAPAGQALRLPLFGRLFPLQSVPSGVYTDRLVVTIVF